MNRFGAGFRPENFSGFVRQIGIQPYRCHCHSHDRHSHSDVYTFYAVRIYLSTVVVLTLQNRFTQRSWRLKRGTKILKSYVLEVTPLPIHRSSGFGVRSFGLAVRDSAFCIADPPLHRSFQRVRVLFGVIGDLGQYRLKRSTRVPIPDRTPPPRRFVVSCQRLGVLRASIYPPRDLVLTFGITVRYWSGCGSQPFEGNFGQKGIEIAARSVIGREAVKRF